MFINLLTHSHYSLLNSSISIDDIVAFALKNKQKYVSLIDINTMYGTMEFYNKAIANKLVPIIGLQITYNNQKAVLVAKNYDGYKQLVLISSFVMTNETFEINSFLNNVYVLVDDIDSAIFINNRNSVFSLNQTKRRPIATRECFFENKGDLQSFKAVLAIRDEKQLVEFDNVNDFDNNYMLNEKEVNNFYSKESLNNLEELLSNCSLDMPAHNKINFVRYDEKIQSNILLQTKCKEGLKHRLNSTQAPHIYIERLKKELDIIDQMHFNDYFLVVQDYVNFAKQNGILVGPGRGSAAGSLVAYTLGITEIDPIKYDLIFERFLNPERATMPDIDIDFMDNRRNEVVEYMFERYGHKRVAHIITFQRMKAKMAIRDIGRILDIDLPIINNISKSIPMEYELDITGAIENSKVVASYAKKYPQLFTLATKLVNAPRQIGLHAAGVVVTNNEMDEIIPIQTSSDGLNVTQYSMEYLENLGLIKMDILGLVNLSTINECIKLIKVNHSINIDLSKIPLNDKKTFNQLSKGDTTGIFQLESPGMRNLIVKIKPTSIEDISITSALFRPGPQKNIPTYLQNKAHPHSINYLNNDFKEVLSSTHNIIIYQEQIIQLVQKVANFSLADADLFRRAISKKNAEKLASLQKQFIDGGIKNNYSKEELTKIFDYIFEFANYGFNHSHSLAYAYVSY
jgi:DNA polymerase-3 subunit alpha